MAETLPPPPEGYEDAGSATPPPPEGFDVVEAAEPKPSFRHQLESFVQPLTDIPTMGGATAARAYIGSKFHGTTYPEEYQRIKGIQEKSAEEAPTASKFGTGAGLVASMLPAGRLAKGVGMLEKAAATIPGAAIAGGLTGAAQGYGETGTAEGALAGAEEGAGLSALGAGAGKVLSPLVGGVARKVGLSPAVQKTADAIQAAKNAARTNYDAAKNLGIFVKPQSLDTLRQDMLQDLVNKSSYSKNVAAYSKVDSVLKDLEGAVTPSAATGTLPVWSFEDLEKLRRKVNNTLVTDNDRAVRQMGYTARQKIDDFIDNLGQHSSVPGTAQQATQAAQHIKEGRAAWKIASRAEDIENMLAIAANRAQTTYSGGNWNNAVRQEFGKLIRKEIKYGFNRWSEPEKKALEKISEGTFWGNLTRGVGKAFAPEGIKALGETIAAITLFPVHPFLSLGVGATAIGGHAAKKLGERSTRKNVENLEDLVLGQYAPNRGGATVSGESVSDIMARLGAIYGRTQYKNGGRIKALEREADRACKALGGELKPIMNMPDDAVVNALRIAKG